MLDSPAPLTNRLAEESSPSLLQLKANPVAWQPWDPAAFAAAKQADKPILLSVGYAACHWCHVMAHESFEAEAIAAQMNALFVNIKVDREERPAVQPTLQPASPPRWLADPPLLPSVVVVRLITVRVVLLSVVGFCRQVSAENGFVLRVRFLRVSRGGTGGTSLRRRSSARARWIWRSSMFS